MTDLNYKFPPGTTAKEIAAYLNCDANHVMEALARGATTYQDVYYVVKHLTEQSK